MCVILLKPAGVKMPGLDVLEKMWNCNKDGAGLAISNKKNVAINKGFMTFDALKDFYTRGNLAELSHKLVVVHFRIGTHGLKDGGNTHPFPMAGTPEEIRQTSLTAKEAIFHNGIFQLAVTEQHVSDTGQFIIDAAKKGEGACILSHWDSESKTVGWSKLCVVKPAGCYDLRGKWTYSDQAEGCLVSNTGWEFVSAGKTYHDEAWGKWGKKDTAVAPGYYSAWDDDDGEDYWSRQARLKKEAEAPLIAPHEDQFGVLRCDLDTDIPKVLHEYFVADNKWGDALSKHAQLRFDAKKWKKDNPDADPRLVQPFNDSAEFGFRAEIPGHLMDYFHWNQRNGAYVFDKELWLKGVAKIFDVIDKVEEIKPNVGHEECLALADLVYDETYDWAALMVPYTLWDEYLESFYQRFDGEFQIENCYTFSKASGGQDAYWLDEWLLEGEMFHYESEGFGVAAEHVDA